MTPWLMGTYPGFGTRTMSEEALALAVDVAGDVEVCPNCRDRVDELETDQPLTYDLSGDRWCP